MITYDYGKSLFLLHLTHFDRVKNLRRNPKKRMVWIEPQRKVKSTSCLNSGVNSVLNAVFP